MRIEFFKKLLFVSDGLAVMSVDLGSEFMKIAIVKVMTVSACDQLIIKCLT